MANRENMEKWAAALESGQYAQGFGALCKLNADTGQKRYCCLGVACEVAIADGVELAVTSDSRGVVSYDGSEGLLPGKVSMWLGLEYQDPDDPVLILADGMSRMSATELNDGEAASFAEIAFNIRRTYLSDTEQEN